MQLGIFRGLVMGARRGVMTSKRGNRRFYKGRGCKATGVHTSTGNYVIQPHRIPQIIVPNLEGFELKPYVSYKAPYINSKPPVPEDILDYVRASYVAKE